MFVKVNNPPQLGGAEKLFTGCSAFCRWTPANEWSGAHPTARQRHRALAGAGAVARVPNPASPNYAQRHTTRSRTLIGQPRPSRQPGGADRQEAHPRRPGDPLAVERLTRALIRIHDLALQLWNSGRQDPAILVARRALYLQPRQRHLARWSGATRDWSHIGVVAHNPERNVAVNLAPGPSHTQQQPA